LAVELFDPPADFAGNAAIHDESFMKPSASTAKRLNIVEVENEDENENENEDDFSF
jgi:hypothetical protein